MRLKTVGNLAAGVFLIVFAGDTTKEPLNWWITHSLVKVRPQDAVPAQPRQEARLYAARNEFEPFQVVLRAGSADVPGVDAEPSDLVGPGGAVLSAENITVYREGYLNLQKPSSVEGEPGEWPDPLIPRVDRYVRERRNAFPFTLGSDRNQPLWVEVYVPTNAAPGDYTGTLRISAAGIPDVQVPIHLTVWGFTLPSTSSLPNTFGFNGVGALKQHRGRYTNDEDLYQLTNIYAKAALLHRISIHGGSMVPPAFSAEGAGLRVDWTKYDAEVGPFLDGTVFSESEPLPGAKATSAEVRTHSGLDTDVKKVLYWGQWLKHFRDKGWADRLFHYLWDEPSPRDFPQVVARGLLARQADPGLRVLVTVPLREQLLNVVDIWTPLINCFLSKPGFPPFCEPDVPFGGYEREVQRGKSVWWYQSCGSHGCNVVGGEYFRGWPSYVIDVPAMANRIMEWLSWKYQIHGELYYNMNEAFSSDMDPWADVYLHGGNGDGTLFYPGRPDKIGGATDIPVESIRLKLIREGFEDYEYLAMLAGMGAPDFSNQSVWKIVQEPYQWEKNPEVLYEVRREMGETLNRIVSSSGAERAGKAKRTTARQSSSQKALPKNRKNRHPLKGWMTM